MGSFYEWVGRAVDPLGGSQVESDRQGNRGNQDRDLEIYQAERNRQWTNAILKFVFLRLWWITYPLVLYIINPILGWVSFVVCVGIQIYLMNLDRRIARDEIRDLGGDENRALLDRVKSSWSELIYRVGLSQSSTPISGVGLKSAYEENVFKRENAFAQRAYGSSDITVPPIVGAQDSPLGLNLTVGLLPGQTKDDFSRVAQKMADAWDIESLRVSQKTPGQVVLTLVTRTPLAESVEITSKQFITGSPEGSQVGTLEDGSALVFPLDQANSVVGGVPGSGKSVCLNVLVAGIGGRPDIQIIGIDCKAGVEFHDWQPRLSAFATDQESALDVLERVDQLGQKRLNALRGSGFKSQARKGYSVEEPMVVVVIDECAELFIPEGPGKEEKARAQQLQTLVSRGVRLYRAAGISFVLATQKPTTDVIPSVIRDNCRFRLSFRCTTDEQAVAILGPEARTADVSPVGIPEGKEFRGYCIVGDDAGQFARGRGFWIQENTCMKFADLAAHLTVPLDHTVSENSEE